MSNSTAILDPSVTGLIIGCAAGGSLLIVIVIGVAVTCWNQKRDHHGIIIANLAAKRIHVVQISKDEAGRNPRSGGTLVSASSIGKADLQIFHTTGRSRSGTSNRTAGGSRALPLDDRGPEEGPSGAASSPEDQTFMSSVYKEETPQVTPRKEKAERMEAVVTTRTVLPFDAFPEQSEGDPQRSDGLQKTSIVINPRENVQTTIILDDTSSVATSLPFVI